MISQSHTADLYRQMLRIRRFDEMVLDLFPRGLVYGTTHTYIGQEANAVGVMACRGAGDVVVSNHRCHGHYLAYGGPMHALAAEMMGRKTGVCGGRGGSQHVQWGDFYANGILGGTVPLAVGMALAEKRNGRGRIVFCFMGDGTLGEGVVYESLNMASLWHLPVVFILENNRYAQSTPVRLHLAGDMKGRFTAFGIPAASCDTTDVVAIEKTAADLVAAARQAQEPRALIVDTYRFAPHSKGDDTRDPHEIASYRQRDPLPLHAARLSEGDRLGIEREVAAEVAEAFALAEADPVAEMADPSVGQEPAP